MAPADAPMPSHLMTDTPVVVLPDYLQNPAFNTPEDHHNAEPSLGAHANGEEEPGSDA
jgi:hypothetical protein